MVRLTGFLLASESHAKRDVEMRTQRRKGSSIADANVVMTSRTVGVVQRQTVTDPGLDGIVLSQSPHGGMKADQGSTVTIVVGQTAPPPPPPTP